MRKTSRVKNSEITLALAAEIVSNYGEAQAKALAIRDKALAKGVSVIVFMQDAVRDVHGNEGVLSQNYKAWKGTEYDSFYIMVNRVQALVASATRKATKKAGKKASKPAASPAGPPEVNVDVALAAKDHAIREALDSLEKAHSIISEQEHQIRVLTEERDALQAEVSRLASELTAAKKAAHTTAKKLTVKRTPRKKTAASASV